MNYNANTIIKSEDYNVKKVYDAVDRACPPYHPDLANIDEIRVTRVKRPPRPSVKNNKENWDTFNLFEDGSTPWNSVCLDRGRPCSVRVFKWNNSKGEK